MAPKQSRKHTSNKGTRKVKKTSSKKSSSTLMSIPELRGALHGVSIAGEKLAASVKKGSLTLDKAADKFATEWTGIFGKRLEKSKAKAYLKHIMDMNKKTFGKTRRHHRGGGNPLMGAPLGYDMKPGADLPYGNFPEYIAKGFVNPEPALLQDCGKQTSMMPYPNLGSNKVGGGSFLTGINAALMRPFAAQNPPSTQQDMLTSMRGQPTGPGSASYEPSYQYRSPPIGQQPISAAAALERVISNETRTV